MTLGERLKEHAPEGVEHLRAGRGDADAQPGRGPRSPGHEPARGLPARPQVRARHHPLRRRAGRADVGGVQRRKPGESLACAREHRRGAPGLAGARPRGGDPADLAAFPARNQRHRHRAALGVREHPRRAGADRRSRAARADGVGVAWQVADRRVFEVAQGEGLTTVLWTLNTEALPFTWCAGLRTSLLLPRGALATAAWRHGPIRLSVGVSAVSGAPRARPDWSTWDILPTASVGPARQPRNDGEQPTL